MRKLTLSAFLFACLTASSLGADPEKQKILVRAVTPASQVNQHSSHYWTPKTSGTTCNGTGTDTGGGTTAHAVHVVNVVETGGMWYTIRCTAHWVGSNCAPMVDGDMFEAEIDGKTMWIHCRKAGIRDVKAKYKILDIRPAPSPQS